jgi:very-short-patch-repair endonuclease
MRMRGFQGTRSDSVKVARGLRQDDTRAERAVWRLLRDRRLTGLKFRRQHAHGKYTVDFFCYELRLAIELDGSVHSQPSQMRKDAAKDKDLDS